MLLLSGKEVQEYLKGELKKKIEYLGVVPKLVILQIGDNEQSNVYIKRKKKLGEELGVTVEHKKFEENIEEENLLKNIEKYNQDKTVGGIIVQLPVPKNLNKPDILNAINPKKDVDGLGVVQTGLFYSGDSQAITPATARGIISLLDFYKIDLESKNVAVIGRSSLVGRPVGEMCLKRNATVTICHSHSEDLKEITKKADILIVACGVPCLVDSSYVKEGQVVVDVGIHRTEGGLCGDVNFDDIKNIISAVSPVPGGVGPLTVVSLFQNLVDCTVDMQKS